MFIVNYNLNDSYYYIFFVFFSRWIPFYNQTLPPARIPTWLLYYYLIAKFIAGTIDCFITGLLIIVIK